jgi:hypothetical protein
MREYMETNLNTLNAFVAHCQTTIDNHYNINYPTIPVDQRDKLEVSLGKRYAKIIRTDGAGRSAFAFVDLTNGDVLKPASWAAPAKGARGNVNNIDSWQTITPYGPKYLR